MFYPKWYTRYNNMLDIKIFSKSLVSLSKVAVEYCYKIAGKKPGPKYGVQKAGCKKQGQCYSKREKARLSLLFLNNNDPAFCTLLFATYFFGPFFLSFRT